MKVDSTIKIELNEKNIFDKVQNDRFGLFLAQEWKRLISPYTPRREGNLEDTALVRPFEIEYIQPYSHYVYYGETFNFRRDANPYATYEWDKAAEKAGQKEKLIKSINQYLARR
nr:MAG TPA: Minor capsid protein [Bacteriophage sp.]